MRQTLPDSSITKANLDDFDFTTLRNMLRGRPRPKTVDDLVLMLAHAIDGVEYAHNVAYVRGLIERLEKITDQQLVGVLASIP